MTQHRSPHDLTRINAKPGPLKLARFFVAVFLVLFSIDLVSIFTYSAIVGMNWQLIINGGTASFTLAAADMHGWRSGIHLWFPTWSPTYFDFSDGRASAGDLFIAFPLWILSTPCLLAAATAFHSAVRRADLCANCRYNIYSLATAICPECGKPIYPGIAPLRVAESLPILSREHNSAVRYSLSLFGLGLCLVLGMRVFIWMGEKQTTLVIPTGYVGTLVFVEDPKGVAPEGSWGRCLYRIPETGVLRVTDIDAVKNYPGTPSTQIEFACREQDGTEIQTRPPWASEKKWFTIEGPYGKPGVSIARIGIGIAPGRLPRELRISPEREKELRDSGVPADFFAPHLILKKGEVLQADP